MKMSLPSPAVLWKEKGLGESAKAALITEGLAEISQLCVAKGGKPETAMGLCGLGDLILTCNSHTSTQYVFGLRIGTGREARGYFARTQKCCRRCRIVQRYGRFGSPLGIRLRICGIVNQIVRGDAEVDQALSALVQG